MYVRKRKTLGAPVNERSGGKVSYRNSSRDGAASVSQRGSQSHHNIAERRNVSHNSDSRSNWSSQRSQENRHSETQNASPFKLLSQSSSSARRDEMQRPPPFKSLLQDNPIARRDTFSIPDRRNNNFGIDRDYYAKNEDQFNNSRSSYGVQHDRWESYDQRESANRGYSESQREFERPTIRDAMEKLFGSEFRYGSTPFATIGDEQRGGNNMSQMNLGDVSYSDRRDDSYYLDRRDDSYYPDKRGYASSDRRRDSSPERRGHSSFSERRGDSFPERGQGSYPGRRNDESSLDRGSIGYYQDRRDSDSHIAKRYDFHSDRRGDNSYSERGYASHGDRRDDDTYTDRKGSDYYVDKRGGGTYPDGRGSSYADGRGAASYMDYERSNDLSYNDQHRGANIPFENRGRADNSHHMKQQRRVDTSYVPRQKQGINSYMDKPRGRSYSSMDVSLEENVSYGSAKRRSKASERSRRSDEKPRGSNYVDDLESPSKDEQQAAMGILKKVLAKQQSSRPRRRVPSAKPGRDGIHNVEIRGERGSRNAQVSKKVGVKDSFRKGYQHKKVEGNVRKTLSQKRPLDIVSSPQNKKPRISVLSRLGPMLEKAGDEVFSRLGPRTGNVKSRLGPRSVSGRLAGQTTTVTDDPAGPKKLSGKEIKKLVRKYKTLPAEILSCSKCKQDKFPSVNEFLQHQIEEHHDQIDASFHKKLESLLKYLQCDAQLAYAHQAVILTPKKAIRCKVCNVAQSKRKPHRKIKRCQVVHEFANPPKCCHFGRFTGRSFLENHLLSLPHFVKFSKMFIKNQERYKYEKEKLELMKKAYMNGCSSVTNEDGSILKVNFLHEVLWRKAKVYQQFGTLPVPEEVSSLLQAYEDLSDPPPVGKVLTQVKKSDSKYYDPSNIHGKYHIVFETNFKCDVCGLLLERSQQSIIDHCSTKDHYDNVVKERQKLRENPKEQMDEVMEAENAASEKHTSTTDKVSQTNKRESSDVQEDGSEEDFNDVDVFGDHHNRKKEKRAQKGLVIDKKDEKAAVKKEDKEENEEAKEVEMDESKEGEPSKEMHDELVNENNKQEDVNDDKKDKLEDDDVNENDKQENDYVSEKDNEEEDDVNEIDKQKEDDVKENDKQEEEDVNESDKQEEDDVSENKKQEDDDVDEKDKQEDDDVDIYSDPYGGGELLEGVEEKQEVGCDDEEYGDEDNAQEQEEQDNEDDAEYGDDDTAQEQDNEDDAEFGDDDTAQEQEEQDNEDDAEYGDDDTAQEQDNEDDAEYGDDDTAQEQEEQDTEDDAENGGDDNAQEQEEQDIEDDATQKDCSDDADAC